MAQLTYIKSLGNDNFQSNFALGGSKYSSGEIGTVGSTTVAITFSTNVNSSTDDYATGVTIKVDGVAATISSDTLQVDTSIVYYVISVAPYAGNVVTWEYDDTVGNISDSTGTVALGTTVQTVTSNLTSSFQISINTELGISATKTFVLPAVGGPFDVTDWGDGSSDLAVSGGDGALTHVYAETGIYTISIDKITNAFQPCRFAAGGDKAAILNIINWGNIEWDSMYRSFFQCSAMDITAADVPITAAATNWEYAFSTCTSVTSIPLFDTSACTNFSRTFSTMSGLTEFPRIDVSSATSLVSTFSSLTGLTEFPLIDTSTITTFSATFYGYTNVGMTVFPEFDTSNAVTFTDVFSHCSKITSTPAYDLSSTTNTNRAWTNCLSLVTVPFMDLSQSTNVDYMFGTCALITSLPAFNLASVVSATNFISSSTIDTADYTALLVLMEANNSNNVSGKTFHGGNSKVTPTGNLARQALIDDHGWAFTDGGIDVPALYVDATSLWKMDEASGDALDAIGGEDGADNSTVGVAAGLVDGARLMVKTSGQYFSIPDSTDLKGGAKSFTIACMFYPVTVTNDTGIFTRWDHNATPTANREWNIYMNGGTVSWYVSYDGSDAKNINSGVTLTSGNWYKIVCWYDHPGQEIGVSINDGTPAIYSLPANYSTGVHSSVQTTEIGAYNAGSTANGSFDQVVHWNRVLSAADITSYNNLTEYI